MVGSNEGSPAASEEAVLLRSSYELSLRCVLANLAMRGDIHQLAVLYSQLTRDDPANLSKLHPQVLDLIGSALKRAITKCTRIQRPSAGHVGHSDETGAGYLTDLLDMDRLPASAYVELARIFGEAGRMDMVFNLWQMATSGSEPPLAGEVKDACDDALVAAVAKLESSRRFSDIAAFRANHTLSEKVGKACDGAMIRAINLWHAHSELNLIMALAQRSGSDAVKDAATVVLAKLENVGDEQFVEAVGVLKDCGELTSLAAIRKDTHLPARYVQIVDAALIGAMDVAVAFGWGQASADQSGPSYRWGGKAPFEAIVRDETMPGSVRSKARKLLGENEGITRNPPDDKSVRLKALKPQISTANRFATRYLLQKRGPSRCDGTLSRGTVPKPARERAPASSTPDPLQRKLRQG